jgi:hypothetical protein
MGCPVCIFGAGAGQIGGNYAAIGNHKGCDHGPFGEADSRVGAGKSHQGAADLRTRGVAVGVENARAGVGRFAGAEELSGMAVSIVIEVGAPLDQFFNAEKAFANKDFCSGAKNNSIACVYGVFQMQSNVFVAFRCDSDSTLRVMGVGLAEGLLGDYQDIAVVGQLDGCAEARDARSHHQKIHLGGHCHET